MCKLSSAFLVLLIVCSLQDVIGDGLDHNVAHKLRTHMTSRKHRAISTDGALRFEPAPYSRKLELGSSGKIHCKVAGGTSPTVQWYLNDQDPLPDGVVSSNGTLLVTSAERRHSGTYTCRAVEGDDVIASEVTLDIVVSPRVLEPTADQELHTAVGRSVWLHCRATGDPQPTTQWDRNLTILTPQHKDAMEDIDEDGNVTLPRFVLMDNGTLLLRDVRLSATDRYGCTAGSAAGLARHELTLIVHPEGELPPPDSTGVAGKALLVSISVAVAYILIVLALMLHCRRRRLRRRARGEKLELEMAEGREKLVEDGEEGRPKIANGAPLQNGRLLVPDKDSGADNSESCVSRASKKSGQFDHLTVPRTMLSDQIALGRGEFGDVLLAKIDMSQVRRARNKESARAEDIRPALVKALTTKDETQLAEFRRQLDLFSRVRHENIARLIGLCNETEPHYMLIEHTDWGDLKQFLLATRTPEEQAEYTLRVGEAAASQCGQPTRTIQPLQDAHKVLLAAHLARANAQLAHRRLTHRDIAARNCIITSKLHLKLSFPALSRGPHSHEYYKLHDQVIPLRWLPSEVVLEGDYSTKSDVYMFAATVWEIYTKAELPFAKLNDNSVMERVRSGTLEWPAPGNAPGKMAALLKHCWSKSPAERPLFDFICEDLNGLLQELAAETSSLQSAGKLDETSEP